MAKKKKEVESLNAEYKYTGDGELLSDISSSKPLKKVANKKISEVVEILDEKVVVEEIKYEPTQKDIYISMVSENRPFTIKINGSIIFDSDINNIMELSFYDNNFRMGITSFPYIGVNFKFKK